MGTDKLHIAKCLLANTCRLLLGGVFLFSGFVKAVDPWGFCYKIQDYLTAFGVISWIPSFVPLFTSIALSAIEFCIGVCLLLAIHRTLTVILALCLMTFMTPLSLYLELANPVSDCGCFGDAWVLSNWQTFWKNLILLLATFVVMKWKRLLWGFITPKVEWMISRYVCFFILLLSFYCLWNLPILDFRPYKIGTHIKSAMEVPEGAALDRIETYFLMEKDGIRQEFTVDNYPDSTWTYIEAKTVVVEKGYEPPIHDFSVQDLETGEDITEQLLANEDYTFLLIAHRIEEADDSNIDLINELYDYCLEHGYAFYALTSSPVDEIELWRDKTGAEYAFCQMDDITLKTIVRSNPGLLLLKDGTILNKWSNNTLPDEYVLTDRLENLEIGELKQDNAIRTIGYTLLWFIIPLLLVIGLDVLVIKRRVRKLEQTLSDTEKNPETES